MLLLAVAGAAAADVLRAALELQGLSTADLESAETAGLIEFNGETMNFVHPLIRSVTYQTATAAERRAAHRTLSMVFDTLENPRARERYAWHLAASTVVPDETVATALSDAAELAAARRSYATAMDMQERAARLSPPGETRVRRLLQAANTSMLAGRTGSGVPLLDEALEETSDWRLRTETQHLRCRIQMWRGQPVIARDLLIAEADLIEAVEPAWAAFMRTHAALVSIMLGDLSLAGTAGRRALELLADFPDTVTMPALVVQALISAQEGEVDEARSLLVRSEPYLAQWDPLAPEQLMLVAGLGWASIEEPEHALRWLQRAVTSARDASAVGLLPFQLSWLALAQWRKGNWTLAYSNAHDAVAFAEETGWLTELPNSLVSLALIEAALGRSDGCREHAARAVALGQESGVDIIAARASIALALLELGQENPSEAVRHLDHTVAFAGARGIADPVLLHWGADRVEALVRSGDPESARAALAVVAAEADRTQRPTQLALAARCRGLLAAAESEAIEEFTAALDWHTRAAQPFDEARTQLLYGELLRRNRHRGRARTWLNTALATFEQLGAQPWADRARRELRAAGVSVRSPGDTDARSLTHQELRVALAVAEGVPNAEAAAQLFLSAKTVEYHLSNIYRKLGIRSRSQLARALADVTGSGADDS
jgi:ATP/maltotriose-dependent transcriptional regulator MalT